MYLTNVQKYIFVCMSLIPDFHTEKKVAFINKGYKAGWFYWSVSLYLYNYYFFFVFSIFDLVQDV